MLIQHSWINFAQATPRWGIGPIGVGFRGGLQVDLGIFRWYLLLMIVCSCAHVQKPSDADRKALDDVRGAWHAAGLPSPGECGKLVEVRRHDTLKSYVDACAGLHPGLFADGARHSAGCLTTAMRGGRGKQIGIIEIAPGHHDDMTLVQHEWLHRASYCVWGDVDAEHSRPAVWVAAGGAQSVQARARGPDN